MNKIKKHLCLVFIISFCIIFNLSIQSNAATGTISTETIRLRKTASTKSDILELLSQGEKVEVISEQDGWYKVKYKGITGYLSKEYVTVKGDVPNNSSDKKTEESKKEETSLENKTDKQEEQQTNQNDKQPEDKQDTQTQEGTTQQPNQQPENQTSENNQVAQSQTTNINVNLYLLPLVNSTIICEIKPENTVNTLEEINNWTYISVNGINGWVITNQLSERQTQQVSSNPIPSNENGTQTTTQEQTQSQENDNKQNNDNQKEEPKQAYIKVEQLNFRKKTSTDSEVIDTLKMNTKVEVLGTEGEWSKIKYDGKQGYVATKYLSDTKVEVTNRLATQRTSSTSTDKSSEASTKQTNTKTETTTKSEESTKTTSAENTSTNSKKSELIAYAKQFLGSRYVHGGTSPKGFDCSGFTQYVYKHFGYNLSRSSSAQSKNGTHVEKSNLQVGDLVFFSNYKTNKGIGHVGIYIGNNQFIHASTEKTGVIISSLSSSTYQKRYVTARRIF